MSHAPEGQRARIAARQNCPTSHGSFALWATGLIGIDALAWKAALLQAFNATDLELQRLHNAKAHAFDVLCPGLQPVIDGEHIGARARARRTDGAHTARRTSHQSPVTSGPGRQAATNARPPAGKRQFLAMATRLGTNAKRPQLRPFSCGCGVPYGAGTSASNPAICSSAARASGLHWR